MNPAPDERDRIRAAIHRILSGTAESSNGALTIVALAQEAEVPRNAVTQSHTDLKAEFYAHAAERGAPPEAETRLRATIAALKRRSRTRTPNSPNSEPTSPPPSQGSGVFRTYPVLRGMRWQGGIARVVDTVLRP